MCAMYIGRGTLLLAAVVGVIRAQTVVEVNTTQTYQEIDGFGFSEAFGYGTSVQNAPAAQQSQALAYMFSLTEGAGFTILRNRIAADPGDTIEPTKPSSPSATPTYKFNDNDEGQVFWSQQARAMGVKYIYADAWSAPGYMKTNNNYEEGGYLCGVTGETCASGDWRQAYANYLVEYVKLYESLNITIDYLGFLNEPAYTGNYDSMNSNGTQAASFIPILHTTLQTAGLTTGVTCCDGEGWNDQVGYQAQIQAAGVESDLALVTAHLYASGCSSPINTKFKVWQTEYADLNDAFTSTWYSKNAFNEGLYWANLILNSLSECNLNAFLFWVGVQANGNSATLVNLSGSGSSTVVKPSGILWAFAMFSRYVRPNAVRVGTTGAPTSTSVIGFKNADNSTIVVMLNKGAATQEISLGGITSPKVAAYYMDNSVAAPASLNTTVSGNNVEATLPAYSAVTFVLTASA